MNQKHKCCDKVKIGPWARRGTRRILQNVVLTITLGVGIQFAAYVFFAAQNGNLRIPRPSSVEGFLPIAALMGWRRFFATGIWDPVHPAAMGIFGFVVLISFFLRNAFCGWFCPVGTVSEWLHRAGQKLFGRSFRLPVWIDIPLRSIKYILLGFSIMSVCSMRIADIAAFQASLYYRLADVRMLYFFLYPSKTTIAIVAVLVVSSLLIHHFWCRYLCPYGALTGLLAAIGPTRVRRHPEACVGCGTCRTTCPKQLPVDQKVRINTPECFGCMQCITACPANGALEIRTAGFRSAWSAKRVGMAIVLAWLLTICVAAASGFWKSGVSDIEFKTGLDLINSGV